MMSIKDLIGIKLHRYRNRNSSLSIYDDNAIDTGQKSGVLFITNGKAVFETDKGRITAGEGDVILFDLHTIKRIHPIIGQHLSYQIINFDMIAEGGRIATFKQINMPVLIRHKTPEKILNLLKKLDREFNSVHDLRSIICSKYCLTLIEMLYNSRMFSDDTYQPKTPVLHSRIQEALDTICRHFKKRLDIQRLAKNANMHPAYFAHLFKKEVGMAPHQFILKYKIEKAKEFLLNWNTPIVYTGTELGFHDYAHFRRVFLKITGMSPMQFIRSNKPIYDPK